MTGCAVSIDGLFGEVVGATARNAEDAPAVPLCRRQKLGWKGGREQLLSETEVVPG